MRPPISGGGGVGNLNPSVGGRGSIFNGGMIQHSGRDWEELPSGATELVPIDRAVYIARLGDDIQVVPLAFSRLLFIIRIIHH